MDFDKFTTEFKAIFRELFPVITSEGWKDKADWSDEERAELNKFMKLVDKLFNDKLARPYNRTIWDGVKDGSVSKTIEPLRKETVRDGTAKAVPTADDIMEAVEANL